MIEPNRHMQLNILQNIISMRRILQLTSIVIILIASIEVGFAQEVKNINGVFYNEVTDHRGKPIGWEVANQADNGGCTEEYVEFVSEINGLPVVGFAMGAFKDNDYIRTMILSADLVANFYAYRSFDIDHNSWSVCPDVLFETFANCKNLQKIILPDNLITTGIDGFSGCTSLNDVTFGSNLKVIGSGTFYKCINLQTITFPNTLKIIETMAFGAIGNLDSIVLPNGLEAINYEAFSGSSVKDLIFPDNVFDIWSQTANQRDVTVFSNVDNVYISSLENYLSIYDLYHLTKNKFKLFYNGDLLTKATIPDGFDYQNLEITSSVEEITLPNDKSVRIHPGFPNPTIVVYNVQENVEDIFINSSVKKETPQKRIRINILADWPPYLSFPSFELYGDPRPYIDIHVRRGLKELYETKGQGEWDGITIIDDLSDDSGVINANMDFDKTNIEYYNLNGMHVNGNALTPGLYIKRQGNKSEKVFVE